METTKAPVKRRLILKKSIAVKSAEQEAEVKAMPIVEPTVDPKIVAEQEHIFVNDYGPSAYDFRVANAKSCSDPKPLSSVPFSYSQYNYGPDDYTPKEDGRSYSPSYSPDDYTPVDNYDIYSPAYYYPEEYAKKSETVVSETIQTTSVTNVDNYSTQYEKQLPTTTDPNMKYVVDIFSPTGYSLVENDKPRNNRRDYAKPRSDRRDYAKPLSDRRDYEKPRSDRRDYEKPLSDRRDYEKPLSDRRDYEKPLSDRRDYAKPLSDRRDYEKPLSDRRDYAKPLSDRRDYVKPLSDRRDLSQSRDSTFHNGEVSARGGSGRDYGNYHNGQSEYHNYNRRKPSVSKEKLDKELEEYSTRK
jgi:hypothetical protein